MFELTEQPIQADGLKAAMTRTDCGGFASFEGWVRDWNEGRRVLRLCYETYEELALKEGFRVIEETRRKHPVRELRAVHRVGSLKLGEVAVWIGATGEHREEAFAACRLAIDEIKARVPIWKKEFYEDGESEWVGCERCAQHADHQAVVVGQ